MGMPVIELQPVERDVALSNVVASIALVEASLAHVLNAESKKIQRVI